MRSPLAIIVSAWEFARRQPALQHVAFWLVFLPLFASTIIDRHVATRLITGNGTSVLIMLAYLAIAVLLIWGQACTLVIGKRLLQAKAGRTRTSFKAVRTQAGGFVIPLLLTGILRAGIILLWSILLIIPGIIYAIRSAVYAVAVVAEGDSYRSALRRSITLSRGRSWTVFWHLLSYGIILYLPVLAIVLPLSAAVKTGVIPALTVDLLGSIANTVASMLYLLATIELYGELKHSSSSS